MKRYYFSPNQTMPSLPCEAYGAYMDDGHMLVVTVKPLSAAQLPTGWIDLGHLLGGGSIKKYCKGCMSQFSLSETSTVADFAFALLARHRLFEP